MVAQTEVEIEIYLTEHNIQKPLFKIVPELDMLFIESTNKVSYLTMNNTR